MENKRNRNGIMPEDILAENHKKTVSPEDILTAANYESDTEDDWTMDLEDAIQRQTLREQREAEQRDLGQRKLKQGDLDPEQYESEEDSVLFEEEESEMDVSSMRGTSRSKTRTDRYREPRKKRENTRDRKSREKREEARDKEPRSRREDTRERDRGMSRADRREYEEFLAYKEQKEQGRRGRKKRHPVRRILITLLVLVLLVFPALFILARMSGIMEGISTADIRNLISDEVKKSQETGAMAGYTNIALFGLDSTQQSLDSGNNRTDVMIIASINDKTGDVKLVSVYRDTYLDIGDGNYQKANAAYAYGGPEQAIKMLNTNLDLNITDYATIGFGGVADMIDAVGGIEIDVQQDEIEHLNNYQSTMAVELGKEYVPVTSSGTQTLNGLQATAYCRIRYTDGGDFKRTERQKEVLSKTFAKLKKSGPITMIKAANSLSSEIRTSLNAAEILSLALKAFRFNISETNGFPNEELRTVGYIGDQSCVIPIHLSDNVVWLHKYLFGDESYQVSETVQSISNEVSARSGY